MLDSLASGSSSFFIPNNSICQVTKFIGKLESYARLQGGKAGGTRRVGRRRSFLKDR